MTVKAAKIAQPTRLPSTMTAMVSQSPSLRTMPSAPRAQLIGAMLAPAQIHICCSPVESLSASGMGSMLWTSTLSSALASVAMIASWPPVGVRRRRAVRTARYCAGGGDAVKMDSSAGADHNRSGDGRFETTLAMTTRLIGARIPRNEDARLLQGLGCFVDDVNPRGVLHAAGVRSSHACARIVRIDTARARALPGVHLVLTAADLGDLNEPGPLLIPHPGLTHPRTQRPLAADRVRYVGELVAFVVAGDRYLAEDAADLIEIEYEPGPAVIDLEHALDPAAPRVHEDVPGNRAARVVQTVGDPEDAFRRAARVLRERLTIERSCGSPIEARGVVAEWDARGRILRVWSSTQAPLPVKNGLARILGLPEFSVEVIAPDVGGGFGTKIMLFFPEEILVPLAAIRLVRPVKWTEDRREHLIAANQERGQLHDVEVGVDDTGRILGLRDSFVHDAGAYTPYGIVVPIITSTQLPGPYRLRDYTVEFEVV